MLCEVTTAFLLPEQMDSQADSGVETGPPTLACGLVLPAKSSSSLMGPT